MAGYRKFDTEFIIGYANFVISIKLHSGYFSRDKLLGIISDVILLLGGFFPLGGLFSYA